MIRDLVGKPYALGGRGPDVYDCAGLALEVQRRRGLPVDKWGTPDEAHARVRTMRQILRTHWIPLEHPEPGCLVFFPGLNHVGTMLDARRFLHTEEDLPGACIEALSDPLWRKRKRLFYNPKRPAQVVAVPEPKEPVVRPDVPAIITWCPNPFAIEKNQVRCTPKRRVQVQTALKRAGVDLATGRFVVSVNGEVLPPERGLRYFPRRGDDVQVTPLLQNAALRTIAMVGVAVAAAAFAGPLGGILASTFGVTAGATTTAIAGSLISIGGSLLVTGIASLFQPSAPGQSYGVQGPATTARSGIPIPKGYGDFLAAGNTVESWVDIQGDNGDAHDVDDGADRIGRQYINCRIDFGVGPARSYSNILLNGKDIQSYADVAIVVLYGTNDQAPVTVNDPRWQIFNRTTTGTTTNTEPTTGFDTINNNYPLNLRIRAGISHNYYIWTGQRDDTQKLTVYVSFPGGVWRTDDSQQEQRLAISYDVYYRPSGSGDAGWIHVPGSGTPNGETHYYYNIQRTLLRQATIIDGLTAGQYDVKVVKNGSGAVNNPLDYFEHESNKFGDELWLESVQETSYTTLAYPNQIQVCLRFMATGQLSGQDVNLQVEWTYGLRSTLPTPLAALGEDNPASVIYDIWHDPLIGAGMPDSRTDFGWLLDVAARADALLSDGDGGTLKLATFNGVYDQPNTSIWQAIQSAAALAHAHPQRIGATLTGWVDEPAEPVQMFHAGNQLLQSFKKTWLNLEDRAQEISVSFADKTDNYKSGRNPARVTTEAAETSDQAVKKTSVNLLGCTDPLQAYYWAVLKLRQASEVLRKYQWDSNRQAIRCRTGNVVWLQHDMPNAAGGGLIEPGSTASQIWLDRTDLANVPGSSFSVVVQMPPRRVMSCTVYSISGNDVVLSGYDGSSPVNRLVVGSSPTPTIDVGISDILPALAANGTPTGRSTFTLDDVAALSVGQSVDLWVTDPLDQAQVQSIALMQNPATGHKATLCTLTAPLVTAPADYSGYLFQSTTAQAVLVRISAITKRLGEQRYTLHAEDYSEDSYNMPAPIAGQSYTPPSAPTYGTGTPNAAQQAVFSVTYSQGEDEVAKSTPSGYSYQEEEPYYTVNGIAIQNNGANYTSKSTFVLSSGYDEIDPNSGAETKDTDEPLTVTLDANGAVLTITGFSGKKWNAVPNVNVTR